MAKFKYEMGSWVQIEYHKIPYAGCSIAYASTVDRKRQYISEPKYTLTIIPISATFEMEWLFAGVMLQLCPLPNKYQYLTIDNEIDYQSFISLN